MILSEVLFCLLVRRSFEEDGSVITEHRTLEDDASGEGSAVLATNRRETENIAGSVLAAGTEVHCPNLSNLVVESRNAPACLGWGKKRLFFQSVSDSPSHSGLSSSASSASSSFCASSLKRSKFSR